MALSTDAQRLKVFVLDHLEEFRWDSGGGQHPDLLECDLYSLDYLEFAAHDLDAARAASESRCRANHRVNCVANLKRALDNQLDVVIHAFRLKALLGRGRPGVPQKLKLAETCGILKGRTLLRLNSMRNAVEHDYKIPDVRDLEAYYDVVALAVAVLQAALRWFSMLGAEYAFETDDGHGAFQIEFEPEAPTIRARWWLVSDKDDSTIEEAISFDTHSHEDFCFAMRLLVALLELGYCASPRYVRDSIDRVVL